MSQLIRKVITTPDSPLIQTTPTLIPGLSIYVLTGAGWIQLIGRILVQNAYAGVALPIIQFRIDGILQDLYSDSADQRSLAQNYWATLRNEVYIRLGAGEHTVELFGSTDQVPVTIYKQNATLTLYELGF